MAEFEIQPVSRERKCPSRMRFRYFVTGPCALPTGLLYTFFIDFLDGFYSQADQIVVEGREVHIGAASNSITEGYGLAFLVVLIVASVCMTWCFLSWYREQRSQHPQYRLRLRVKCAVLPQEESRVERQEAAKDEFESQQLPIESSRGKNQKNNPPSHLVYKNKASQRSLGLERRTGSGNT